MKAGQLRHRVTIQSQVSTQDALGQPSTSWLDTKTVWADVRYQQGLEAIRSGTVASLQKVSVRVRNTPVSPGQRVIHGTTVLDIENVMSDANRQFVDLVCQVANVSS